MNTGCYNCKWLKQVDWDEDHCRHSSNIIIVNDPFKDTIKYKESPSQKNEKRDCKCFIRKFNWLRTLLGI